MHLLGFGYCILISYRVPGMIEYLKNINLTHMCLNITFQFTAKNTTPGSYTLTNNVLYSNKIVERSEHPVSIHTHDCCNVPVQRAVFRNG